MKLSLIGQKNCLNFMLLCLCSLLCFCAAGCTAVSTKPKPGRCNHHTDCPDGFQCKDTYCEDMYFPRREIKPY